jgi:hypothetical protein
VTRRRTIFAFATHVIGGVEARQAEGLLLEPYGTCRDGCR